MECPAHAESAIDVLRMQSQHGMSCACRVSIECPAHAELALDAGERFLSVLSCNARTLGHASNTLSDFLHFYGCTPVKKGFTDMCIRS